MVKKTTRWGCGGVGRSCPELPICHDHQHRVDGQVPGTVLSTMCTLTASVIMSRIRKWALRAKRCITTKETICVGAWI